VLRSRRLGDTRLLRDAQSASVRYGRFCGGIEGRQQFDPRHNIMPWCCGYVGGEVTRQAHHLAVLLKDRLRREVEEIGRFGIAALAPKLRFCFG